MIRAVCGQSKAYRLWKSNYRHLTYLYKIVQINLSVASQLFDRSAIQFAIEVFFQRGCERYVSRDVRK